MTRLPEVKREDVRSEDLPVYDGIAASRGQVRGPFAILMYSPNLAQRVASTGAYLRFESVFPQSMREIVTLAIAREINSQYEFSAHATLARKYNVSESIIDILRRGGELLDASSDEAVAVRFVRELVGNRKITTPTFAAANERFGSQGVVELSGFAGHYATMAYIMCAFELEPEHLFPADTLT
jgi:4-carboxymuconolactone decarboxylase